MAQLILIRGIPGSGKSTLAEQLLYSLGTFPKIARHYEADMYFVDENNEYNFDASKIRQAHEWCQEQTRESLKKDRVVIVSNTFTTIRELRPYFDIAKEFALVPVVYLAQNQFNNVHGVPEDKLKQMRDRFCYDISSLYD